MLVAFGTAFASSASADTIGPITFEPPSYAVGDINGQQGWLKLNPAYDVKVAAVSSYPAASAYGFGTQALRLSDAFTSGSFGDQTFSPGLTQPAGEAPGLANHFDSTFWFGTALATAAARDAHVRQPGQRQRRADELPALRGSERRGPCLLRRRRDSAGPIVSVGCANFVEKDIATLNRTSAHSIRFSIDFKPGPGNDVVKIYIDGSLATTGTTWEDYYRYDPEAAGNGNQVSPVNKMLFRESGAPNPFDLGKGFLVDGLSLSSATQPHERDECKNGGWADVHQPHLQEPGRLRLVRQ